MNTFNSYITNPLTNRSLSVVPERSRMGVEGNRTVDVEEVRLGDLLLVRQGERFPVDCLMRFKQHG